MDSEDDIRADTLAVRLAAHTIRLLEGRRMSIMELAASIGMKRSNLSQYLRVGAARVPYKHWNTLLILSVATAFGMTPQQFVEAATDRECHALPALSDAEVPLVWDPSSDRAIETVRAIAEYEDQAAGGIGFFRVPPCPVLFPNMVRHINHAKFGALGELGGRVIGAYEEMDGIYRADYLARGGRYGDFEVRSIMFESDVLRLIQGDGEFTGCEQLAIPWLDSLLETHIKRMNYRIAFVRDDRVPQEILWHLWDVDSVILIGHVLSVRRSRATFGLSLRRAGPVFDKDQRYLRALDKDYAEYSFTAVSAKIDGFRRHAERCKPRFRRQ